MKYYFSQYLQRKAAEIAEPFLRKDEWLALKIPQMEMPCAAFLLTGKVGTGKTTLAKTILKKISGLPFNQIPRLSMGEVASEKLGNTEQATNAVFKAAFALYKFKKAKNPVVILDEVDAIAWTRGKVSDSSMFMLSVVNNLLINVDDFLERGGAIAFTTNHEELLDPALLRRMTDKIVVKTPEGDDALKIWQSLMPPTPFGATIPQEAAHCGWTPNEIAKRIFQEVREAFLEKRNMRIKEDWFYV